jgi:hypothetical protein
MQNKNSPIWARAFLKKPRTPTRSRQAANSGRRQEHPHSKRDKASPSKSDPANSFSLTEPLSLPYKT